MNIAKKKENMRLSEYRTISKGGLADVTVGIDAASLTGDSIETRTGLYTVTFNIVKHLARMNHLALKLYSFSPFSSESKSFFPRSVIYKVIKPKTLWMTCRVSLEMLTDPPDIFIGFSQSLPLITPKKSIVWIYDLAFEFFPECYPKSADKLSWQTRKAVAKADKIIAISRSTKKDIVRLYGVPHNKIEVVYLAAEENFQPVPKAQTQKILKKYGIIDPFFLFVGSIKPIKNISNILLAFTKMSDKIKNRIKLVITGSIEDAQDDVKSQISILEKQNKLIYAGYVPKNDLPCLYSSTVALISPSLYEGFGLPILEALSCGSPVITSDISSMPEVAGNAALYVNPMKVEDIEDALLELNKNFGKREKLAEIAILQAKKFSWEKSARKVYKIIRGRKKISCAKSLRIFEQDSRH